MTKDFSLAPMWEREELLSERSELSNSGEGYKVLPSPDASHHPPQGREEYLVCEVHRNGLIVKSSYRLNDFEKKLDSLTLAMTEGHSEDKVRRILWLRGPSLRSGRQNIAQDDERFFIYL